MKEEQLKLKNVALKFVTGDTILTKLFPHKELPHMCALIRLERLQRSPTIMK